MTQFLVTVHPIAIERPTAAQGDKAACRKACWQFFDGALKGWGATSRRGFWFGMPPYLITPASK
ncbi:hypothetical protein CU669_10740 [Paramagnetospirillum kuznetsovii]|uniref:Uncharacterized protein n=1 Tax=Paramagnetospirillum kuznetsovii TaxID=2053833 RepID=A0A364NXQ9_9PROT|nr:hypothetical protein CU669_10740 [Paramagnetospirillum kuznetsovii]